MNLPEQDRQRIVHDLIISLDKGDKHLSREEWQAAWKEEIQKRIEDIEAGRVELLDGEQVLAELRAKYIKV